MNRVIINVFGTYIASTEQIQYTFYTALEEYGVKRAYDNPRDFVEDLLYNNSATFERVEPTDEMYAIDEIPQLYPGDHPYVDVDIWRHTVEQLGEETIFEHGFDPATVEILSVAADYLSAIEPEFNQDLLDALLRDGNLETLSSVVTNVFKIMRNIRIQEELKNCKFSLAAYRLEHLDRKYSCVVSSGFHPVLGYDFFTREDDPDKVVAVLRKLMEQPKDYPLHQEETVIFTVKTNIGTYDVVVHSHVITITAEEASERRKVRELAITVAGE